MSQDNTPLQQNKGLSSVYSVILAGGYGTRFWPISRERKPKQFLSISGSTDSLLESTISRISAITPKDRIMVVANQEHQELVAEQAVGCIALHEPCGRNTAASIGWAALHLLKRDKDSCMIVLPADHTIKNQSLLIELFKEAIELASNSDNLITIGIRPSSAHTGYGYMRRGEQISPHAYRVQRFFEKPNFERAKEYFISQEYFWNSGMFVWRADTLLNAIKTHLPEMYQLLKQIEKSIGQANENEVTKRAFEAFDPISIDFGVLEHARNCVAIEANELGWSDVGSWDAWAEHFNTDENGNLLHGDALTVECSGCIVHSEQRHVSVLGMQDVVVIDSKDAVLVCPRSKLQEVKRIVSELKTRSRSELL